MKKLSLRPYPGTVILCRDRAEYLREARKHFQLDDPLHKNTQGRMRCSFEGESPTFVLFANAPEYLAHEMSHVVLCLFEYVGIDPRDANGEPFCYLLSQLLLEAA